MAESFSITVSVLALALSSLTAWLTLLRRGTVKMTQPTVIFFGPDTPRSQDETPMPKVYLRALLFSTAKRGRVIESMHVALSRNETHQNFNIWVYGEEKLVRGSGCSSENPASLPIITFLPPKTAIFFISGMDTIGWNYSRACSEISVRRGFFHRLLKSREK
jgi:hypothetical protein